MKANVLHFTFVIKFRMSLWDAIKIRIAGHEVQHMIEILTEIMQQGGKHE